jgi:hypothetical protein
MWVFSAAHRELRRRGTHRRGNSAPPKVVVMALNPACRDPFGDTAIGVQTAGGPHDRSH